jgi:uncharacterized protein (DUF697 family)
MKLVVTYTAIAGILAAVTAPIPGTSLLLTGLEIFMIVHLSKKKKYDLNLKQIGFTAAVIWGISSVLKDVGLELLRFAPGLGWFAAVIVAVIFVFFLGCLANLYFSK